MSTPADPRRKAEHDDGELGDLVVELLADRNYHAQRADDAERGRDHAQYWYGCRWERLRDLLRETSLWAQAAAIMANGTADPHEPPTYAQQLNIAIHRAESAEQAQAQAKVELARLRARVRVEAEDVEQAGVTRAHVESWLTSNNWGRASWSANTVAWRRSDPPARFVVHGEHPGQLADAVHAVAFHCERPGLDILDEMASMELPA